MPCAERKAEEVRSKLIFAKVASYCKAHAIGALAAGRVVCSFGTGAAKFWTRLWTRPTMQLRKKTTQNNIIRVATINVAKRDVRERSARPCTRDTAKLPNSETPRRSQWSFHTSTRYQFSKGQSTGRVRETYGYSTT